MAKDPAFLFYPSDFLTGTMFMSNEQIGIYIRLLCSQHQHGGIIDKDSFNALVGNNSLIKNKFVEVETGFYNERLTTEMEKRNKKSNNMSEVAKDVWKKRKEQLLYKSKENEYNCITKVNKNDTIVIQPVNRNEDINIINNKIDLRETFFSDFPNSSYIESICRDLKMTKEQVLNYMESFRLKAKPSYPNFDEFAAHYKNCLKGNQNKPQQPTKTRHQF